MADQIKRKERPKGKGASPEGTAELTRAFTQKNLLLFVIALAVIVLGHISLGMGSITFAPICLVVGYCVLVPLAIIS